MPFRAVDAQRERVGARRAFNGFEVGQRFVLHRPLDLAALPIEGVELSGQRQRLGGRLREQAADAYRHVREPAGGVEARSGNKAQVEGRRACRITSRNGEKRRNPGMRASVANA